MKCCDRYVLGREHNVVLVDFRREPDPPAPKFPGAAALRKPSGYPLSLNACTTTALGYDPTGEAMPWEISN
jgi:hypothetical protein